MNSKLFTIWLPISIVIHIVVLLLISAVTLAKKPAISGFKGKTFVASTYPKPIPFPTQDDLITETPEITPAQDNNPKPITAKNHTNRPNSTEVKNSKTPVNSDASGGAGPKNPNKNVPDGANGTNPNGGRDPGAAPKISTSTGGRNPVGQDENDGRGIGGGDPNKTPGAGKGDGVARSASVSNIKSPVVSKDAENAQFSGIIDVILTIDTNGKIRDTRLGTRRSDIDSLNNAAIIAARNSTGTKTKMVNGVAVEGQVTITYSFSNGKLVGKN